MRASISASLIPLFARSDLSSSSNKKFEVRMNAVEPLPFIRKMKNRSGSLPLTLATPHFLFGIVLFRVQLPTRRASRSLRLARLFP